MPFIDKKKYLKNKSAFFLGKYVPISCIKIEIINLLMNDN